ncbi:hypothetical protein PILCRDRAFT_812475 [Piloderma croceum F 1598]|uniref:Uncharacterized protein n=1 Tax=Piloderma croceum (strain F 1598) TaxID=765440 RepID=A0A0C3BT09_PILCF|nr:hypothetical protein PILCRDRAFT_812475 [Piloderma croceum F 1598]
MIATSFDMDVILAPDSKEEGNHHPQRNILHVSGPSHSSNSKTPDLPSWTTFSSRSSSPSSQSDNESIWPTPTPENHDITEQVDVGAGASFQLPELLHSAGKQASGAIARSSPIFIGVVIPIRRPLHSSPPKNSRLERGVVSTNNKAEIGRKREVAPGPVQVNIVSEDSAARTPVSNTLLSALTNTFERNKYPDPNAPQHSPGPASSIQLALVRKAKEDSAVSAPTGKGILKVIRPTQLRPLDVDALLGTEVAPMRIDRKRSEEARIRMTHVRFQLDGEIIGVGDGDGAGGVEKLGENGGSHERMVGDASGIYTELRLSRDAMYAERLETMFGPGSNSRGAGVKPKKVRYSGYTVLCLLTRLGRHQRRLTERTQMSSR